jgi:hypothetical protein
MVANIFYAVKTHDSLEDLLCNMTVQISDSVLFFPYHRIIIFISSWHSRKPPLLFVTCAERCTYYRVLLIMNYNDILFEPWTSNNFNYSRKMPRSRRDFAHLNHSQHRAFFELLEQTWSRVGNAAMDYERDGQGSFPGRSKRYFSSPQRSNRLWGPPASCPIVIEGSFHGGKVAWAHYLPVCIAEVKNGWAILPLPTCFHCVVLRGMSVSVTRRDNHFTNFHIVAPISTKCGMKVAASLWRLSTFENTK